MDHAEFLQLHGEYLTTPAWQERRRAVLKRDHGQCQAALDVCSGRAEQVHHLTYRHWRNEPLFDLVAVCWLCHQKLTALDRGDEPVSVETVRQARAEAESEWLRRVAQGESWVPPPYVLTEQRLRVPDHG